MPDADTPACYPLSSFSTEAASPLLCFFVTMVRSLTVLLQAGADVREDKRADAVAAGDSTKEDAEPTSRAIANTTMFIEKFILLFERRR